MSLSTHEEILALRKAYAEARIKQSQARRSAAEEKEWEDHMVAYRKALHIIDTAHRAWIDEYYRRVTTSSRSS